MAPPLAALVFGLAALVCARAQTASDGATASDIDPSGACKTAIASLCSSETPGDGRLARCVRQATRTARARKESSPVTPGCSATVLNFFVKLAASGINPFSSSLITAEPVQGFRQDCKEDIQKYCQTRPSIFVMTCLKAHKSKLNDDCREKIFKVQTLQADHLMLDAPLANACKDEINSTQGCRITQPPGAQLACLKGHRKTLGSGCRKELFRREQEDAEDIRLNMDVFTTCKAEIGTSCKDLEFGEAAMLKCLWDASLRRGVTTYSERCRQKVQNLTKRSVTDYRLDFRVRTTCLKDIDEFCKQERESVDRLSIQELFGSNGQQGFFSEGQSGQVLRCLKGNFIKLKSPLCKEAMTQVIRIQAAHAAADPVLMRSCNTDLSTHCQATKPGQVHACLRKHLGELSPQCREEELLQGVLESRDITLKPRLFHDCKQAMGQFCQSVTPGAARMLQCLQDARTKTDFPKTCKDSLEKDLEASNKDWRLKFGISENCKPEMERLCQGKMQAGGGKGLTCLKNHFANVTAQGCKQELRRYVRQGNENIRLAPTVYEKCINDVELFCKDVSPGSGRVHDCLMKHRREISQACAEAEFQVESLQTHDITTAVGLTRKCAGSRKKLCPDAVAGSGQMWKCLEDKRNDEGMAAECKEEVVKHMQRKHAEFHLNPQLEKFCTETARKLCPNKMVSASFKDLTSEGEVISCLIEKRKEINNTDCKKALWQKEKQRTSNLDLDPVARDVCRTDSAKFCSREGRRGLGEKKKCLAGHLANLTQACGKKVTTYVELAAEDVRFKKQLYSACKAASKRWCEDVKEGMGRKTTCLLNHMHSTEMEPTCRDELVEEQTWRARNIMYNPALKANCKKDIVKLLEGSKCGEPTQTGWKIDCLTKNSKDLESPDCKKSVTGVMQRQSADYRAKPGMDAACKADMQRLCSDTTRGGGRMHQCLRKKADQIQNKNCKAMVNEVHDRDKHSASINYNVRKNCYNEKRVFCAEAQEGTILGCLARNMNATHFSKGCRTSLQSADLKSALKEAPVASNVQDLVNFLKSNRTLVDKYGWVLLGGTIFFVILCGFVISYVVIQKKLLFAAYSTVAPRDQPEDA